MNLDTAIIIGKGFKKLMGPLIEVVIHDLKSEKIVFIEGTFSQRKVGDASLIENDIDWENEEFLECYSKMGFDGRLIKSISIPIKQSDNSILLMCINCDVSLFKQMQSIANSFLKGIDSEQPVSLFKNDYQEKVHEFLHQVLKEKGWSFDQLNTKKKKEIAELLFSNGAFREKNSVEYIAKLLDMGRATLFNYLKEWRE